MITTICRWYDTRNFDECGELNSALGARDLIGVTQDTSSENTCIVTYPHHVLRYKLITKEPFHVKLDEWVTRYKLTSAVVYEETIGKYIGIFHDHTVRIWGHEIRDFEETTKHIFRIPILKILKRDNKKPLVIFRNGDCVTLPYGLEHCGTFGRRALVKESSAIVDVAAYTRSGTDHVCYVVKDNSHFYYIITFPLKDDVCDSNKLSTVKVSNAREVKQGAVRITGKKIVVSSAENPVVFFTWSDSCISKYDITKKCWKHNHYRYMRDMFKEESNMACIGKNYFAFFVKGYYPKEANILMPHINIAGYQFKSLEEAYTEDAKVYSVGDFVIVADAHRTFVLHVTKLCFKRPSSHHDYDFSFLLGQLRRLNDFLPIFGVTETSKWNQFSKYNCPKPKYYT